MRISGVYLPLGKISEFLNIFILPSKWIESNISFNKLSHIWDTFSVYAPKIGWGLSRNQCKFFSCHLICFEIRLESQVWAGKITKPFQIKMKHCESQWWSGSQQKSQNTLKYVFKSKYYSQGDNLESSLQCVIVRVRCGPTKEKYLEHFLILNPFSTVLHFCSQSKAQVKVFSSNYFNSSTFRLQLISLSLSLILSTLVQS